MHSSVLAWRIPGTGEPKILSNSADFQLAKESGCLPAKSLPWSHDHLPTFSSSTFSSSMHFTFTALVQVVTIHMWLADTTVGNAPLG